MSYSGSPMGEVKHLLLLAACLLLVRCQQKPKVSMFPTFSEVFIGDLIYLRCDTTGSTVKWYFNGKEKSSGSKTFKTTLVSTNDTGDYYCEDNGQKSDKLKIDVLGYVPSASLAIRTGQPVMQPRTSIILQLQVDESLSGWKCYVYRGGDRVKKIILRLPSNHTHTHLFEPRPLDVPETIFWCNNTQNQRSNQVTVRTSEKQVALEAYTLPAVTGEVLTLKCLAWGTDQISEAVFYENDKPFYSGRIHTYKIDSMTAPNKARYRCRATFVYPGHTAGPPDKVVSDDQDIYFHEAPVKASLSEGRYLQCYCKPCSKDGSCHYQYYRRVGQEWSPTESSQYDITSNKTGIYACRAVWKTRRSSLSNIVAYEPYPSTPLVLFLIVAACLVVIIILAIVYFKYKRRNATGALYEDVGMRSREKGEDKYEMLRPGAQKEAEYDTINPEASGQEKKEAEYQPLKTGEMKEGVYHTLGAEGAAGGEGGYEALKKEGMKEGVYHSLGAEGAAGGEGGYEALKKEGMKEGVYHSLSAEGAAGEGGYEALKKEGMKEGVYHTLKSGEADAGQGRPDAVKNEGMKAEV